MKEFLIYFAIIVVVGLISFFVGAYWKKNKVLGKAQDVINDSIVADKKREDVIVIADEKIEENEKILEEETLEEEDKEVIEKAKNSILKAKEFLKYVKENINSTDGDSN